MYRAENLQISLKKIRKNLETCLVNCIVYTVKVTPPFIFKIFRTLNLKIKLYLRNKYLNSRFKD